jgi:cystathionine gamma-synthase
VEWVERWSGHVGRIAAWTEEGPWVTCFPRDAAEAAKKYWRHTGEGVSSRLAEAWLQGAGQPDADEAKRAVRQRIAQLVGVPADCVLLFGSGMSAIYTVYRAISGVFPGRRSVQFGFPYVDTLKIQQDLGPGVHFFPRGDERELQQLGPNLGTCFSLCCPFRLLAHFQELEWAEGCGVSRYLLRFSVGLESPSDLIGRMERALAGL